MQSTLPTVTAGGGVLGADGKIYCVPTVQAGVLVIDPSTRTLSSLCAPQELTFTRLRQDSQVLATIN